MIARILPFPLLTVALTLMWLMLTRFSPGQLVLGLIVAMLASHAMAALEPKRPRIARWSLIPRFAFTIFVDIIRSNLAVAWIILQGKRRERRSGFIDVDLEIRDPVGLAILAIILTATPGSAWLDYNSARGNLVIHVFDLVDEAEWRDLIKNRYERMLMEILA